MPVYPVRWSSFCCVRSCCVVLVAERAATRRAVVATGHDCHHRPPPQRRTVNRASCIGIGSTPRPTLSDSVRECSDPPRHTGEPGHRKARCAAACRPPTVRGRCGPGQTSPGPRPPRRSFSRRWIGRHGQHQRLAGGRRPPGRPAGTPPVGGAVSIRSAPDPASSRARRSARRPYWPFRCRTTRHRPRRRCGMTPLRPALRRPARLPGRRRAGRPDRWRPVRER